MPADDAYIDTSALAKRYLNEAGSAEIGGYPASRERVFISRLTIVELHCVFARRRRNHEVTSEHEQQALIAVAEDVSLGFFQVQPLDEAAFVVAIEHIKRLRHVALRTLAPFTSQSRSRRERTSL